MSPELRKAMAKLAESEHFMAVKGYRDVLDADTWEILKGKSSNITSITSQDLSALSALNAFGTFVRECEEALAEEKLHG